jgi:hypothetical protein
MTTPPCNNEAHDDDPASDGSRPPAVVLMTWPDNRFKPAHACARCAIQLAECYVLDDLEDGARHPVTLTPVRVTEESGVSQ